MTKSEKSVLQVYAHTAKIEGNESAYIYIMRMLYVLGVEPLPGDEMPEVSRL